MKRKILFILVVLIFGTVAVFVGLTIFKNEPNITIDSIASDESRERGIFIKVADEKNMPIKNADVYYEQLGQNFMYNVGDYWDEKGTGTNTAGIYLDWSWRKLEPEENVYNWTYLETTGLIDKDGRLTTDAEHVYIRLGVIATSSWIVGEGMDNFTDTGYPAWIDKKNLTAVKTKYLRFVKALLSHLKFKPDFYMVEVEVNALGLNAGLTNQEIIDWLDELTNKIKETDKDAKVSIVVTSDDLSPFFKKYYDAEADRQDRWRIPVSYFLERTESVKYDIITVLIQPFGWVSKGDSHDAKNFIESLNKFNKSIYIGWAAFLAEEPDVPEELNPNPNEIHDAGFIYYPNSNGHSEEWQKNETVNLMNYIVSNPKIIGVHWDMYDFVETGTGGKNISVKLATGFTSGYRDTGSGEVIKGRKRIVFDSMKKLWQDMFSSGIGQTDENGTVIIRGFPGKYKFIITHPDYKTKELAAEI